jgi:hypothetical protein
MSTHYFVVPIEAPDSEQAWQEFWNLIADGVSDRWDAVEVDRTERRPAVARG